MYKIPKSNQISSFLEHVPETSVIVYVNGITQQRNISSIRQSALDAMRMKLYIILSIAHISIPLVLNMS